MLNNLLEKYRNKIISRTFKVRTASSTRMFLSQVNCLLEYQLLEALLRQVVQFRLEREWFLRNGLQTSLYCTKSHDKITYTMVHPFA